jgi:hypothetical protein
MNPGNRVFSVSSAVLWAKMLSTPCLRPDELGIMGCWASTVRRFLRPWLQIDPEGILSRPYPSKRRQPAFQRRIMPEVKGFFFLTKIPAKWKMRLYS